MFDVFRQKAYSMAVKMGGFAYSEMKFMANHQWLKSEVISEIQRCRLKSLLIHANKNVPYYKKIFASVGLFEKGSIDISRFAKLPILTKSIALAQENRIYSHDSKKEKWIKNYTSGSTGEPFKFIEDEKHAKISGGCLLRFFYSWHGINPGERQIRLWGSGRDLFFGKPPLQARFRQWIEGVRLQNAFQMTIDQMEKYIKEINRFKPAVLRGYVSNLYELALFADNRKIAINPPRVVISSAGRLYDSMRRQIEKSFGCSVINHYGSREVHNIAMECPLKTGLHVSDFTIYLEILDKDGKSCPPGVEGDIVLTSLTNYAMPFIRYFIGDRGVIEEGRCSCGRGFSRLRTVTGRRVDCFVTRNGRLVPGEYFIYLLGVFLHNNPFSKVQAIQEDYDLIIIKYSLKNNEIFSRTFALEIASKIKIVMGQECRIEFESVKDILTPASGKYQYTVSKIKGEYS